MSTAIDRDPLNALADRFDKLARSDSSLIASANALGNKTAYQVTSNMGRTDTQRTFMRLAREAMDALDLPSPGGRGAINGWLAHLFAAAPDATITGGSPVWKGDAEQPDGQLVCREIRNAAEASAVVVRAAISKRKADAAGDEKKKAKRPSNRRRSNREPTKRQLEVVTVINNFNGNFAEAARQLGLNRKTVKQHFDVAMRKVGKLGAPLLKQKTKAMAHDHRGQVDIAGRGDGPAAIGPRARVRRTAK